MLSVLSSRVGFYVTTFQSLSGFEEKFHKEMGRVSYHSRPLWTGQVLVTVQMTLSPWAATE